MEVRDEGLRLYTYHYTPVTTDQAAMRAILSISPSLIIVRDKVTRQCPQTTTFLKRKAESRSGIEPRPLCLPA